MRNFHRLAAVSLLVWALFLVAAPPALADTQTHIVQPGENLFRIGLQYGISVEALMRANGLSTIYIYVGQTLIIPDPNVPALAPVPVVEPQAQPAPVVAPGEPVYHIVQPGETLFRIGLKYNLPWTKIQVANNLPNERVYAGQQLVIPVAESAPPAPAPQPAPTEAAPTAEPQPTPAPAEPPTPTEAPAPASDLVHIVQPGQTLYTIGLTYNLKWTTIMAANSLPNDRIFVGQRLTIPADPSTVDTSNLPAPAPIQGPVSGMTGKYFLVDLSEQRLYAFEGDTMVRTTLVSTGRWPYPTVTGTYHIYARYTSTRMVGPGYDLPNVPYTQYFFKGYGLHGTYWHNNFGTPMSHGCVNMPTPEAEWAFSWATIGTTVIVQQ